MSEQHDVSDELERRERYLRRLIVFLVALNVAQAVLITIIVVTT